MVTPRLLSLVLLRSRRPRLRRPSSNRSARCVRARTHSRGTVYSRARVMSDHGVAGDRGDQQGRQVLSVQRIGGAEIYHPWPRLFIQYRRAYSHPQDPPIGGGKDLCAGARPAVRRRQRQERLCLCLLSVSTSALRLDGAGARARTRSQTHHMRACARTHT